MDELLRILFHPEAAEATGADEPISDTPIDPGDKPDVEAILAEEEARIEREADAYFANKAKEEAAAAPTGNEPPKGDESATRQRDAQGRFIKAEATPTTATPAAEGQSLPKLDNALLERAKIDGVSAEVIAKLQSDADLQAAIKANRISMLEKLGIDPMEFIAFRNAQRTKGDTPATPPPAAAPAPVAVEPFKLDIDENELDPGAVKALRSIEEQFNKAKADLVAEQTRTREARESWEKQQKQSAEAAQQAQEQAQLEQQFDSASSKHAAFTAYFGKPSELNRIAASDPFNQKVQDLLAFDSYFTRSYARYQQSLGHTERALELAIGDAWDSSPFSKIAAANGQQNGNKATFGPGSVPRGRTSRTVPPSTRSSAADEGDIDAELERIRGDIDRHGGLEAIMAGGPNGRI